MVDYTEYLKNLLEERIESLNFFFSIISFSCCFIMTLLIIFNKTLRSLTFFFLSFIYASEILWNIGNILLSYETKGEKMEKIVRIMISFSDCFTMFLFCFLSYCSLELITKNNRDIMKKQGLFALLSFCFSSLFSLIIFLFSLLPDIEINSIPIRPFSKDNILSYFYLTLMIMLAILSTYIIFSVIIFLKDAKKKDPLNSWKTTKIIKLLFRYTEIFDICWLSFLFLLILKKPLEENIRLKSIISIINISFSRLRGCLIVANSLKIKRFKTLFERFFEIYIKQKLLGLDFLSDKKGAGDYKIKQLKI